MVREVLELLAVAPGANCIDATVNGGGHAAALLEAIAPNGRLLGIDRDPHLLPVVRTRLAAAARASQLEFATGDFRHLAELLAEHEFPPAQAILFDLGLSSFHFDVSGRGFSFQHGEPLDMRFDPTDENCETASEIIATRSADELTGIFRTYGEERFASRIARTLVAHRARQPIQTTSQLFSCVEIALPAKTRWRAARNAARVFQALRIAVNDELGAVREVLPQALAALAPQGRLAVLSFHSLEDRLVKHFFRDARDHGQLRIVTKRPLRPSPEEVVANPRAASAKLRVAERV